VKKVNFYRACSVSINPLFSDPIYELTFVSNETVKVNSEKMVFLVVAVGAKL
jgi:hypothetical protein